MPPSRLRPPASRLTSMHQLRFATFLAMFLVFPIAPGRADDPEPIPHAQDKPPGPPLSPEEALEKMTVPEGFSVELVASEPDIVNPVAMTFDESGRIWITESLEYPRKEPGPGQDRVKVLEDTDADGKADRFTVFAEGLNIPSGIAVGHGGVWVANAPDILYMQDADGDLKADRTEVVVTGFGRDDTHELPNSLTWGPDGWLYGLNGVFNRSKIEHQGKTHEFTCALFRIHPRTREFEVFAEGTSNPWGVAWDDNGSAFVSACVIDHLWHLVETGYYHRQGGPYPPFTWKIESIVEHKHQKAAYCGIHYFDSDAYPPEYRKRLYMGNIHGGCVNVDSLSRDGSTYKGAGEADFLTANDAWFMPVVQKTGPDGCLYILDWYDRYHCYQDAGRDPEGIDRGKGRLYRVRHNDAPASNPLDLAMADTEKLVSTLGHRNVLFRETAQRILAQRQDQSSKGPLEAVVLDDAAPRDQRMHSLWALIGADLLDDQMLVQLLSHDDPAFCCWAVRAAGDRPIVNDRIRDRVAALAGDESPDVRLQVAIAARKIEGLDPLPVLIQVLAASGEDRVIPQIVWRNVEPLLADRAAEFIAAIESIELEEHSGLARMMPFLVDRLSALDQADPAPLVTLLARLVPGSATDRAAAADAFATIAAKVQTREIREQQLDAIRDGLTPLVSGVVSGDPQGEMYLDAAFLAASWNDPAGLDAVRGVLSNLDRPHDRRLQALDALIAAGDGSLIEAVAGSLVARSENPSEFRGQVIASLGRLDDPRVADVILAAYPELEPDLQPKAIELLTQRAEWAKPLLAAIGEKRVPATALNLNQVRRLLAGGDAELAAAVTERWGTIRSDRNPNRERLVAQTKRMLRENPGDAIAGEAAFKKVCAQCHKIYGEGQEVGPDVTSNGRGSYAQLLSNVLDPSLVIGADYQARTIATTDGRILTGLLVEEGQDRIVLKIQGGKLETVLKGEIEIFEVSKLSMMPEDVEKQLQPQEIVDLFAYLVLDKPPSDPAAVKLAGVGEVVPRAARDPEEFQELVSEVAPGFACEASGEGGVEILADHNSRRAILRTHPVNRDAPCILKGTFELTAETTPRLRIAASHHEEGDWQLVVKANGETLADLPVGPDTVREGWLDLEIDLAKFAGSTVEIEVENRATDWTWEHGYWERVELEE